MKTLTLILAAMIAGSPAFGQTTTEDIVKLALSRHPKIAAAKAAIEAEKAGKGELTSPFKPMASLNGYAAGGDGAMIFSSTIDPINQAMLPSDGVLMGNLMLMWKVWTGGRDSAARSLGDARIKSAKHMLAVVEQDVALGVRLALSEYAYAEGALRAAEAARDAATEAERNAETMEQAGKAPRAFVLRAGAEARRAEQDVAKAEAAVKSSLAQLEAAAGGPVEVGGDTSAPLVLPTTLEEALKMGGQRQELQFFAAMADAHDIKASYVRKSLLPEVSIMAMGMSMERANGMSETNAKFGLVFSIPLSDGGMRRSRAKMLEAQAKEFMAQAEDMRLTVRKEIQAAWADWEAADRVVLSAQAGLAAADESYEVERLRFDSGKSTMVELLDALSMLEMARLSVVEADKYRADSKARLLRAIGALV